MKLKNILFLFLFFVSLSAFGQEEKSLTTKAKDYCKQLDNNLNLLDLKILNLEKNLNLAIAELTISKESLKEAETIAEKQKTSLDNLNKSLQDLAKQYKKSKILYTTAIVVLSSVIIGQTMYMVLR